MKLNRHYRGTAQHRTQCNARLGEYVLILINIRSCVECLFAINPLARL